MSDNFGFEKIERDQADQDENVTSTSMTENVEDAPEEDMFQDDFPQKGANLLDDSKTGSEDMFTSEVPPSEPLISFGSPASDPTPSKPEKNEVPTESVSGSTMTSASTEEGCWMKTVDPRDDIVSTSLKPDMDDLSPSNRESTSPPISAESLTGPFNGGETDIGNLATDSNKSFDKDSDSSSIISSSDNIYSSSADESDSESGNANSDDDCHVPEEPSVNKIDELDANYKSDKPIEQQIDSAGLDYEQLKMEASQEDIVAYHQGSAEDQVKQDVDEIVENDEIETMEKSLPGGAELELECSGNVIDSTPVAGLSENDMLDVIERLTKEDNSNVEACSAQSLDNLNGHQAAKDDEYERFIRGEEVLSVDNASPVVSDSDDSVENKSGSENSDASDSENAYSCTDSDVSDDEGGIGNWSPSPLYGGILDSVTEGQEHDNEEMDVEESSVLAGYEYEGGRFEGVCQDNELNSLRADVKGLMEEMEAIVNENEENRDSTEPRVLVDEMVSKVDNDDQEKVPEVLKENEHLVSIMSSGSRERSKTPDNESIHVKFQSPTNVLFYDPDCPIVERVSAEVADVLIDHEQNNPDQETTELSIEQTFSPESENDAPDDLNVAVVKDLQDVYNNLEAEGQIESTVVAETMTDTKDIHDIATKFSNEVLEEARKEGIEGTKDPFDSSDKQEILVSDSLYPKRSNIKSDIEFLPDYSAGHEDQDIKPAEISEDIMTSEALRDNECAPVNDDQSAKTGITSLPQVNVDSESEKELKSQLLTEKDEFGPKNDDLIDNDKENLDEVMMRPKHASVVESSRDALYEEDLYASHDIDVSSRSGSMIVHDVDDTDVQSDVSEAVKQTLAAYRNPAYIKSLNEELETNELPVENHKIGLDEVERKRRYSSGSIDAEDNDYLVNKAYDSIMNEQAVCDSESEGSIGEHMEDFDSSLNETVIAVKSNELDVSVNKDPEPKLEGLSNLSVLSAGDENGPVEYNSASMIVSDTLKLILSEVLDLIYWRDLKKTGVVFGTMLFILLSLTFFTILSVAAYLSLAILTVTLSFRVYKNVMQAVQKTNEGHPFKKLLDVDIALREDVVQNAAEKIASNMNNCCKELRRLFLVEDYVDSLKFGLLLWLMTYVGSWFNGMTLVILAVVCIFTLPKVYETYQGPIDQNVNLVRGQLNNIMAQVSSKIPFPKKKAKTQ